MAESKLNQAAELASHSNIWTSGVRTGEKSLQGFQCLGLLFIAGTGFKSITLFNRQIDLTSSIAAAGGIKKCLSAAKGLIRDVCWFKLGKVTISTKEVEGKPDVEDWHKGSLGKQIFIIPTHFLAIPQAGEFLGLWSVGKWGSWISSVSKKLWLLGMSCECIDSWNRHIENRDDRHEKGRPYGRVGATLAAVHPICSVVLEEAGAPEWLTNTAGLTEAGYWIGVTWLFPEPKTTT